MTIADLGCISPNESYRLVWHFLYCILRFLFDSSIGMTNVRPSFLGLCFQLVEIQQIRDL